MKRSTFPPGEVPETIYLYDDPDLGVCNVAADELWRRSFARYQKAIELTEVQGGIWLDCACGSGYGTEIVAEIADFVCGLDNDPAKIRYAKKHHARPGKIHFEVADITALEFDLFAFFAAILSIETIEHVLDCQPFLHECYRLLRPGGVMVITTPVSQYGGGPNPLNEWHVNELTLPQFYRLASPVFDSVECRIETQMFTTGVVTEQIFATCKKEKQ